MEIIIDTQEKRPLVFPKLHGCLVINQSLPFGDYGARHGQVIDSTVFERKAIGDLFTSYTHEYEREKKKFKKAKKLGFRFILAIEGSYRDVLRGVEYCKKDGLAMNRQLMTLTRKYDVPVWYCESREAMAMMIQEYFWVWERHKELIPEVPVYFKGGVL